MTHPPLIRKASGDKQPFSPEKLQDSLKRAGADKKTSEKISDEISNWLYEGMSTKKIYRQAFNLLHRQRTSMAARYKLKQAIMELGPTGYPFERYIGQLLSHFGYKTEVGVLVDGRCVRHEVDVIATSDSKQILVECKFFNARGKFANVKVPLYIRSRVDDIIKKRQSLPEYAGYSFQGWIVTNTRFTTDAIDYGNCTGLRLIGWDYPAGNGLKEMIERENFFPVTALTSINSTQKKILIDNGIVICRQICQDPVSLDRLDLSMDKLNNLREEVDGLCGCS
jgi:hypothetical protein